MRRHGIHGGAAAGALLLLLATRADAVVITQYTIPTQTSGAEGITAGPDGRIWFTETVGHHIGAVSTDGVFAPEIPTVLSPHGITSVPGNALAFAGYASGGYGLVGVDGGEQEMPGGGVAPWNMVFAPDGRIWTTDLGATTVTAFHYLPNSPATASVSISYPAFGIALGPDERLWVTAGDEQNAEIAACPLEGGPCSEYHLPTKTALGHVTAGADGNVWFTERTANRIGRLTIAGVLTEFPVPTPDSSPFGITTGSDGNVWFTESASGKVGRITKSGLITEFPAPGAMGLAAMTAGPDGNVWFLDETANRVGKVQILVPGDVNADGGVTVADIFFLIDYLFAGGPAPK